MIPPRLQPSPGQILRQEMQVRWLSVEEVAIAAGLSPDLVEGILDGTQQMTPAISKGLSKVTGASVEFWTRLGAGNSGQI